MKYTYFYKERIDSIIEFNKERQYDYFISCYNENERVLSVFNDIVCDNKFWIVLTEYGETDIFTPTDAQIFTANNDDNEGEIVRSFFRNFKIDFSKKVCIDITGFLRPHLAFLIMYLKEIQVKTVDILYTDPIRYLNKEKTAFSSIFKNVDQITGYKGAHSHDTSNDFLIIGTGYDNKRISEVSKYKNKAKKVLLFGFPSLQADMFQENILKAYEAEAETGKSESEEGLYLSEDFSIFAPANDPFVTAEVLSEYVTKINARKKITNLYLSPLSTKVQTLGMCLYYIYECIDKPVSMIIPYCEKYEKVTSEGISKMWLYVVEFPD